MVVRDIYDELEYECEHSVNYNMKYLWFAECYIYWANTAPRDGVTCGIYKEMVLSSYVAGLVRPAC